MYLHADLLMKLCRHCFSGKWGCEREIARLRRLQVLLTAVLPDNMFHDVHLKVVLRQNMKNVFLAVAYSQFSSAHN